MLPLVAGEVVAGDIAGLGATYKICVLLTVRCQGLPRPLLFIRFHFYLDEVLALPGVVRECPPSVHVVIVDEILDLKHFCTADLGRDPVTNV